MKKLFFILLLFLVLLKTTVFVNQENIMHPAKRSLQPYHHEWLEALSEHGIDIKKHISKEETPYLIVKQNSSKGLSKRQAVLAEQLGEVKIEEHYGTLVLLHGKNGRKEDLLPVAERYVSLGFTCLLPDLPHHGESQIKTLYYGTQEHEKVYVDKLLVDASKYMKIDNEALYVWGMSLGGAFAIVNVAHSEHDFKGMVLVSTFDRLDVVLKRKSTALFAEVMGNFLYKGLEKSLKFFYDFEPRMVNSAKVAEKLTLPVYMLHGKEDELIAHEQGKKLFDAFGSKKKVFYLDEEGDHHNILVTEHEFYKESGLFLMENAK